MNPGGGSSFSVKSNAFHEQGVRSGNGYVVVSYYSMPLAEESLSPSPSSSSSISPPPKAPSPTIFRFNFTGAVQVFNTTNYQFIRVLAYGAGSPNQTVSGIVVKGGKGALVDATIQVPKNSVLSIYVGGEGKAPGSGGRVAGGWNGGGAGSTYNWGGGGGGATDIRLGGTDLLNRIVVAGGGGGAGNYATQAGHGGDGGYNGGSGLPGSCYGGPCEKCWTVSGGTQTSGGTSRTWNTGQVANAGTLGQGGAYSNGDCGGGGGAGGGGGDYGGQANANHGGGGGGSSHVKSTNAYGTPIYTDGFNIGDGYLILQLLASDQVEPTPQPSYQLALPTANLTSTSTGGPCDPNTLSSSRTHTVTTYSQLQSAISINNAVIDIQADITVLSTATGSGGLNVPSGITATIFSSTKSSLMGCNCGQCGATDCGQTKRQLYVSGTLKICNLVLPYGGSRTSGGLGGALHVTSSGSVEIEGSKFTQNGGRFGNAIYTAGKVTILNSEISNYEPDADGGVNTGSIYVSETGILTVNSTVFSSNRAYGWNWSWDSCCTTGGALAIYGSFVGYNVSFISNSCPNFYGGAIYLKGGSVTIKSCTFSSNSASQGNAIYVDTDGSLTSSLSTYGSAQNIVVTSGAKQAAFCETVLPEITGVYTNFSICLNSQPNHHPTNSVPITVSNSVSTFSFTGSVQSYTVPSSVGILRIQAYGAQGILIHKIS